MKTQSSKKHIKRTGDDPQIPRSRAEALLRYYKSGGQSSEVEDRIRKDGNVEVWNGNEHLAPTNGGSDLMIPFRAVYTFGKPRLRREGEF
jgi:hypothetical protein